MPITLYDFSTSRNKPSRLQLQTAGVELRGFVPSQPVPPFRIKTEQRQTYA